MPSPSPLPAATVVARLSTDGAAARHIGDVLSESFDPEEVAASAFEQPDGRWVLALYFRNRPDEAAVRALVASAAGAAAADALRFETLSPTDWVRKSLEGLTPVEAGRFVVHGAHRRAGVRANQIGIQIEAALAFGTGHHGTTRGCLLALDGLLKQRRPRHILDLGTGTGVLASDIDPEAVAIARANARANKAGSTVTTLRARGTIAPAIYAHAPYDLVFANILVGPLKRLAAPVGRLLAPGATVILSGLLHDHANAALAAYRAQGLRLVRRFRLDEWTTLVLSRHGAKPRRRPASRHP